MEIQSRIEEQFLKPLIDNQVQVAIFLKNGIKLTGKIIAVTNENIFLGEPIVQMIYKKYISTIVEPASAL